MEAILYLGKLTMTAHFHKVLQRSPLPFGLHRKHLGRGIQDTGVHRLGDVLVVVRGIQEEILAAGHFGQKQVTQNLIAMLIADRKRQGFLLPIYFPCCKTLSN